MMWIMPLVFSVMFFFFPAGLVLYWLTNNILSIAQQYLINKRLGVARQVAPRAAAPPDDPMPPLARHEDPIVAIATASGRGAVGIVRVSGAGARAAGRRRSAAARSRRARRPTCPSSTPHGAPIDRGLAIFFPAPHSYTGEDVLELQAHGGAGRAAAAARALPRGGGRARRRDRPRAAAAPAHRRARASSPSAPFSTTSSTSPRPRPSPT